MRLHRFIGPFDLHHPLITLVDPEQINQISRVLRLGVGDSFMLCDGANHEAIVHIASMTKTSLTVTVGDVKTLGTEPLRDVTLYCAILKRENFEWVCQKATEIGVREIVPLLTERTVKQELKIDRLKKIILEAAEQSGRGRVPLLHPPVHLEDVFQQAPLTRGVGGLSIPPTLKLFCHFSDQPIQTVSKNTEQLISLFIGPEGGWSDAEVELARHASCQIVSLGNTVLRAETAAIVATYVVVHGS